MTTHEIKSKNIEDVETPNVNNDAETVTADVTTSLALIAPTSGSIFWVPELGW